MLRDCHAALAMTGWRKVSTREGFRGLVTARLGAAGAVEEMLGHEVGLDEVEVDGIVGVFGVVAGEVIGVAGGEGVDFSEVVDKEGFGGGLAGYFVEFLVAEGIAVAVVAAVFADAGIGIAGVVDGAVPAEFDVLGKATPGFDLGGVRLSGVRLGFGLGYFGGVLALIFGIVVEAEAEEFLGGGEAVAGFEVRELALHGVDEEADGGAAVVGFVVNDFGEGGTDAARRLGAFGLGLRFGPRMGFGVARLVGLVEDRLGGLEAEFDEEPGGVETVAGLGVGRSPCMVEMRKRTMRRPSWVSWAMMSAMLYICSDYKLHGRRVSREVAPHAYPLWRRE